MTWLLWIAFYFVVGILTACVLFWCVGFPPGRDSEFVTGIFTLACLIGWPVFTVLGVAILIGKGIRRALTKPGDPT